MANFPTPEASAGDPGHAKARERMVETQIRGRGVREASVLTAMRQVPRHLFVPQDLRRLAYADRPLPIGHDQTISQPFIVALMTRLVEASGNEKVLEIGTGSGYHAAVLSRVVGEVYTIEIVEELGRGAAALLERLGYDNVHVRVGDGFDGWPEEAPFDAIVLTAAPEEVPAPLVAQLRPGGRIILPLGGLDQELVVLTKDEGGLLRRRILPVRFVPMTGKAQEGVDSP